MKIGELVRQNIKNLKPFSSARSEYTGVAEVLLDANESPYETSFNRYPDPYQLELKNRISEMKGLLPGQIILGNGSDEIIDLIVRTFCVPGEDIMRFITPSFGMYEVAADINDINKEAIPLTHSFDLDVNRCLENQSVKHKLLFLCSPNNPTGNVLDESSILEVIKGWKGIVVVDEAYVEFCQNESLISKLNNYANLIILQTFSKAKGAAGLRLGMGFSSTEIIGYLNKIKPPYNVNSITQEKAKVLLSQQDITAQQIEQIVLQREIVAERLSEISGIDTVYPSNANFLLVKCQRHLELYDYLVQQGIVVRDRSKLRGCASCLRMTIGLRKENEKLVNAITEFYK